VRTAFATFTRNWITTRRAYPWSFFIGIFLSGSISVIVAYFTYTLLAGRELHSSFRANTGTDDYMSFVILGTGVYLLTIRVLLGVSRSMITERREGTLEALLLAPASRLAYFAGVTLQWLIACSGEMVVLLLFPVVMVGLFGMALVLGAVMLASGDTYISQNTCFAVMMLVCGFTFPRTYLPIPLQALGATLPATGVLDLLRAAVLEGAQPAALIQPALLYFGLGLIYSVSGLWLIKKAERRALEG
jgi:ABC-2 type transport system permease protein